MEPLVSILIPAFNAEAWIAATIKSALAQTWPRKEIIVVDDGSKDETLRVVRGFEGGLVKVATQPNQGAAAARNKALSLSRGEYVQWLDADDLLNRDKISKQLGLLKSCGSKKTLASCGWGYFVCRPEKAQFNQTPLW